MEVGGDRGLVGPRSGPPAHEKRTDCVGGERRIVEAPEMVLERDELRHQAGAFGAEDVPEELEQVAQALGLDADAVQGGQVRVPNLGLVREQPPYPAHASEPARSPIVPSPGWGAGAVPSTKAIRSARSCSCPMSPRRPSSVAT